MAPKSETYLDLNVTVADLQRAIEACASRIKELDEEREQMGMRIHAYTQLLRIRETATSLEHGASRGKRKQPSSRRLKGKTIAEAVAILIGESKSGKMHAKQILEGLVAAGRGIKGKNPAATLFSTMKRSQVIERAPGEPNTWRLKAATIPLFQTGTRATG